MTYRTEFTDFPPTDMPAMPLGFGFEDSSWRNDTCPCFTSLSKRLMIWVDYVDVELREYPDLKRFMLQRLDENGCITDEDPFLETDDWNEVLSAVAMETTA